MFELWSAARPGPLHFKQAGDERSRNNYTETFSENLVPLLQKKKIYDRWKTSSETLRPLGIEMGWNGFKKAFQSQIISRDIKLSEGKLLRS